MSSQSPRSSTSPWERLFVFPPYTTEAELRQQLGPLSSSVADVGIAHRDDITLLVFVGSGRVHAAVEQPRTCDFSRLRRDDGWPRAATKFRAVRRVENGVQWVELQPIAESPAA